MVEEKQNPLFDDLQVRFMRGHGKKSFMSYSFISLPGAAGRVGQCFPVRIETEATNAKGPVLCVGSLFCIPPRYPLLTGNEQFHHLQT